MMISRVAHSIALAGLFVLGCASLEACQKKAAHSSVQAEPQTVTLVPVEVRDVDRYVEVTGTLYGEEEVTIAAEVPGRVVAIHADLGDAVASGTPLAQIDRTDYELAVQERRAAWLASLAKLGLTEFPSGEVDLATLPSVARAEAEASNARARLERARQLHERTPPLISDQDYADIQTQYDVAFTGTAVERLSAQSLLAEARVQASGLRIAEQRLADTTAAAPRERQLTYRVAARRVSVGEVVAEGQPLFRLVASDRVKFRGLAPERYTGQVLVGARVMLFTESSPEPFVAQVARVSPAVDIATRSFEVEVEAENRDSRMKPGGFVRARIVVGSKAGARFVPASAVVQFAGVQRVFSVKDGKAVEHRVTLGAADNGRREVLDGLPDVGSVVDQPRAMTAGTPVVVP